MFTISSQSRSLFMCLDGNYFCFSREVTCASVAAYGHSLGDYFCSLWVAFPMFCVTPPLRIVILCFPRGCLSCILSLCFSPNVFSSPMWTELTHVQDPYLRRLADKLPEVVLGSTAYNTTLTYLNGFKGWRTWASKFPEITVLPATPAFVALYLLSVLQASTSPSRSSQPCTASAGRTILLV